VSEVFEGVLFRGVAALVQPVLDNAREQFPVDLEPVGKGLSALFRTGPRADAEFSETMDRVAALTSELTGSALLIRYDSRVGYRSSALYQQGRLVRAVGPADERWIRLDRHSERQVNGPTYSVDELELDPDAEYETLENAVELGLDALGAGDWDELRLFMARH
jgi:hypothetical protein